MGVTTAGASVSEDRRGQRNAQAEAPWAPSAPGDMATAQAHPISYILSVSWSKMNVFLWLWIQQSKYAKQQQHEQHSLQETKLRGANYLPTTEEEMLELQS